MGADGPGAGGSRDLRGRAALRAKSPKRAAQLRVVPSTAAPRATTTPRVAAAPLTPVDKLHALDVVVNAIAHPARRQILLTLHFRGGTATAGELAARFEHAWPTTTRHLRVLEDAGLLAHEKRGRTRLYTIDHERLALVAEWLGWFRS